MLKIIVWPNPTLCKASEVVTEPMPVLAQDMYETMKSAGGVGLSAVQVGILVRLVVVDVGQGMETYYNPVLVPKPGTGAPCIEGCLSAPGIFETVNRHLLITVRHGMPGEEVEEDMAHLKAQCLQHEIEHLDGKFFLDKIAKPKRGTYFSQMVALKKNHKFMGDLYR